jgi:hypothetical protein
MKFLKFIITSFVLIENSFAMFFEDKEINLFSARITEKEAEEVTTRKDVFKNIKIINFNDCTIDSLALKKIFQYKWLNLVELKFIFSNLNGNSFKWLSSLNAQQLKRIEILCSLSCPTIHFYKALFPCLEFFALDVKQCTVENIHYLMRFKAKRPITIEINDFDLDSKKPQEKIKQAQDLLKHLAITHEKQIISFCFLSPLDSEKLLRAAGRLVKVEGVKK